MEDIPKDILEAARQIAVAPVADEDGNCLAYFAGSYTGKCVRVVALAILAERERCAAYIRSTYRDAEGEALRARFVVPEAKDGYLEAWQQANDVADAIRLKSRQCRQFPAFECASVPL